MSPNPEENSVHPEIEGLEAIPSFNASGMQLQVDVIVPQEPDANKQYTVTIWSATTANVDALQRPPQSDTTFGPFPGGAAYANHYFEAPTKYPTQADSYMTFWTEVYDASTGKPVPGQLSIDSYQADFSTTPTSFKPV